MGFYLSPDRTLPLPCCYRKEEAAAEDVSLPELTPDERDKEHHHAKGIST